VNRSRVNGYMNGYDITGPLAKQSLLL